MCYSWDEGKGACVTEEPATSAYCKLLTLDEQIGCCAYCVIGLDDGYDDRDPAYRPPQKRRDAAEVVRADEDSQLRRRGGRPDSSPTHQRASEPTTPRKGNYPLMPGYSGIDIVD